jgi:small-conductance mechanosensitive channel
VVGPFYGVVDRTWSFLLWVVAGVTAARLVGGLTPDHRKRIGVYVLVAIVVFIQLCRLIALPVPLFRFCIFLIALWGLAFCAWQSIKIRRRAGPRLFRWGFRLAGLVFLSVTLLELAGYHILAAQLLESSLKTLLLVLLGWMFVVLLEGWVKFILQTTVLDGIPRFRSNAQLIEGRLTNILSVIVFTFVTVILLVVWRVYENVGDALEGLFSIGFSVGSWKLTLGMIIIVAIALYVSFVVSWLVQGILLEKVFPRRRVQLGVQMSMTRLVHYGIIFVGFLLALSFLGVDMKNITIIGGALGVGIGFGLQSIVSNFVSGLILLFERPIKAGDYVQLGERWGEISRVGLRSTVVRTFDRSEVVVPNSHLISNEVTNWTLSDRSIRLRLPVGVAYGSDIDKVIATLEECGRDNPTVLSNPPPQVLFMNFGESCLDFELRVWVSDIDNMVVARSEINQEIDRTFRAAGIEIAFPQRDLHLRSVDPSAALPLHRLPNEKDREATPNVEKGEEDKNHRDE